MRRRCLPCCSHDAGVNAMAAEDFITCAVMTNYFDLNGMYVQYDNYHTVVSFRCDLSCGLVAINLTTSFRVASPWSQFKDSLLSFVVVEGIEQNALVLTN